MKRLPWFAGLFTLVAMALAAIAFGRVLRARPPADAGDWAMVRRVDLATTLLAGGDLQPAGLTTLTCEVEDMARGGPMTILTLAENGAPVKKGDVICRIDGSAVVEAIRLQRISIDQARAEFQQAELNLDVALVGLREYEDGLIRKKTQDFRGKAALKRSDLERQADRLVWAEEMLLKGYLSRDEVANERQRRAKLEHDLRKVEIESEVFQRYSVPKETLGLKGKIDTARTELQVAREKLQSREGRLADLRRSEEKCTILAPRDGIVLRANARSRWTLDPLEPGSKVRQGQDLLTMPDDGKTEIDVSIHETVGSRVRIGTPVKIRVWARPDRIYPGRVAGKSMFPIENWKEWDETLRHYVVRVTFDEPPVGVLPLMSADVIFDTGRVPDALVIPIEAMSMVDGRQTCRVAVQGGSEVRPITIGQATTDLLQVTEGLEEGEYVLLPHFGGTPG
ncbi:efflux RND transporter periplasmic adaptor subunit [Tundrisphaera sp. TA3]|uniref:efflux RND transporter periplasmic adaptor subunit n=1 Tax=Tundrisphaera sp. TA3 TaxID=3435775 RepID=UPI003EBB5497